MAGRLHERPRPGGRAERRGAGPAQRDRAHPRRRLGPQPDVQRAPGHRPDPGDLQRRPLASPDQGRQALRSRPLEHEGRGGLHGSRGDRGQALGHPPARRPGRRRRGGRAPVRSGHASPHRARHRHRLRARPGAVEHERPDRPLWRLRRGDHGAGQVGLPRQPAPVQDRQRRRQDGRRHHGPARPSFQPPQPPRDPAAPPVPDRHRGRRPRQGARRAQSPQGVVRTRHLLHHDRGADAARHERRRGPRGDRGRPGPRSR